MFPLPQDAKVLDRTSQQNIRTGKMTVYLGGKDNPYTIFDFSPNKSFEPNKKMFEGFVQADAATGFDALFTEGKRIEIGCCSCQKKIL